MVDAESVVEEEGCWRCLRKHVELEMKLAVLPLLSVAAARLSASAVVEVDRKGSNTLLQGHEKIMWQLLHAMKLVPASTYAPVST